MAPVARPRSVDVSLSAGVDIVWSDGHASRYAVAALRRACPCATCNDLHGTGAPPPSALPLYQPVAQGLLSVEPVGRYGLRFAFSDGHTTGIYTWEQLRSLCACALCRPAAG